MNRERLFSILWRLAMLALPWQTRWIFSVPNINGFPWEQGTAAVYVSWIVIVATILMGMVMTSAERSSRPRARPELAEGPPLSLDTKRGLFGGRAEGQFLIIAILALILSSFFTSSVHATLFWWSHVILLTAFAWTLISHRVPAISIAIWFILSLIPHAALGIWQFWSQHIFASTLLGIASQFPADSGVSVVETAQYRILRVYGGFPHPNIFGAWLAVGLTLVVALSSRWKTGWKIYVTSACAILFSAALVLTFSRGAWLAAIVGIVIAVVLSYRKIGRLLPFCIAATVILVAFWQWDAVVTRFTPSARLESWSLTQRSSAIKDGLTAWRAHPLVGWGPGAGLVGISVARTIPSPVPLEPPHAVPLVILLETGIVGVVASAILLWMLLRSLFFQRQLLESLSLLGVTGILALTDHTLWTFWPGQGLLMIIVLFFLEKTLLSEKNSINR